MKQMLVKWLRRDCRIEEMYEGSAVDLMALAADEIERLRHELQKLCKHPEPWGHDEYTIPYCLICGMRGSVNAGVPAVSASEGQK